MGLDLFHQGDLLVHFFLGQGGNLDLEITGHGDAAGLVGDGDGHGDQFGLSARHIPVDPDAGGVVHARFFQHVIVAGGDGDGAVFAVDAEVTGAGDADVLGGGVDTIGIGGQLRAGDPIPQTGLCKASVHPLLQGRFHGVAASVGGHDDVEGFGDGYVLSAVALQGGGERHRGGDGGLVDGHLVVAVIAGSGADLDYLVIAGGPGEIAPTQVVPVLFQNLRQGQFADLLGGDGHGFNLPFQVGTELALVPRKVGVPLLFYRDPVLFQDKGDVEIGAAAAEAVLGEVVGDGAVLADGGAAVAGRVLFDGQLDAVQLVAQLFGGEVDEVGVGAVDGSQAAGHGVGDSVQSIFGLRLTQRVQGQGVVLGLGLAGCRFRNGGGQGHGHVAGLRQRDCAIVGDVVRVAAAPTDGVAIFARGGGKFQGGVFPNAVARRELGGDGFVCFAENGFCPDGVQVEGLIIFAALVPVVLFKGAVQGRTISIGDGAAIAAGGPACEAIALTGEGTLGQGDVFAEGGGEVFHGAGHSGFVARLDVELNDILIVSPMGVQGHFVTGKFGVGSDLLAALFGSVPAVQGLVVRIVVGAQVGQAAEHLVGQHRLVADGALVAVAVKVDGDALHPVGVEGHGGGVRELVLVGDLTAALGCVIPAVKDPTGAGGVLDGGVFGAASLGIPDIVVVLTYDASSLNGSRPFIVEVDGDRNILTLPGGAQGERCALLIGQVLFGGIVPTGKIITGTGESTLGQGELLVIGGGDGVHGALAAVGVKGDGIGDGRPLGGEGDVLRDNRLRCQLGVVVEPATKQVTLLGALAGDPCAADGVVGRDLDSAGLAIVVKGDGGGVCPTGVQLHCLGDVGHRCLVGVDHIAFSRGGPADEDFSVTGEGVGLQGALAAVDVLGIILTGAAVGVEGDGDACTGGEAAEVNAVIVLVAAAVLFVSEGQGVAGRHIQFHQRPVHKAADAVYHGGGVVGEGEFVVIGLGGYLVLEGQMGVCGGGQG